MARRLGGLDVLERHRQSGGSRTPALVIFVRCRTVAKVDSIVILSRQEDHDRELLLSVLDGVGDGAAQHGRGRLPRTAVSPLDC